MERRAGPCGWGVGLEKTCTGSLLEGPKLESEALHLAVISLVAGRFVERLLKVSL